MKIQSRYLRQAILCGMAFLLISFPVNASEEKKPISAVTLLLLDDTFETTFDPYDPDEFVDEITSALGEDEALEAIILALDKGYSLKQIVEAGMAGRISTTGVITDSSGNVETPQNPPYGMIVSDSEAGTASRVQSAKKEKLSEIIQNLKKRSSEIGEIVFMLILSLLDVGYSFNQLMEGIMFDTIMVEHLYLEHWDIYIIDENMVRIIPANKPRGILGYKAEITGPPSLKLVDGKAQGTWTVTPQGLNPYNCSRPPFYAFYYGDSAKWKFFDSRDPVFTATHWFQRPGVFQVRALYVCRDLKRPAYTNTLAVEVKFKDYAYHYVSLKIEWTDKKANLGLAAVKDGLQNFYWPHDEKRFYWGIGHGPIAPTVSLTPYESGKYVVVVWVDGLQSFHNPKIVTFDLTVEVLPYNIVDQKVVWGTKSIQKYKQTVTIDPNKDYPVSAYGYTGSLIGVTAKHPD